MSKHAAALALALILSSPVIFGQNHFSGFAGAVGNMEAGDDGKFQLTADAFFAGHLDFKDKLHLRAGATIHTSNLATEEVFDSLPASVNLDEVSLTLKLQCCHVARYLAIFAGEYESIGSDLFLQRQFGVLPVSSRLSETWIGMTNLAIYPFSGLGLSYVVRLKTPQAFGGYFYVNEENGIPKANVDLRFGGVFPVLTLDFSLGFDFPFKDVGAEEDPLLNTSRNIGLHTGLTAVIGNGHTASLFFQFGLSKVILKPDEDEKVLQLSDLYFLVEPRFKANFMNFHFTLFNMPERIMEDLFLISNPLGCNLAVFAENLHAGALNFTLGSHLTVSAHGVTLDNFNDIELRDLSLKLSPFAETPIGNGTLMARFTMDLMEYAEIYKSMKFTFGYKSRL